MKPSIEYFYSHLSPYAYLGHNTLRRLADQYECTIQYRPVNLMAVFEATGGLPLGQRDPARLSYRVVELKRWREERNLPLNIVPKAMPTNPALSDCMAIAIVDRGGDPGDFSQKVFQAFWADDQDLADKAVLASLLKDVGEDVDYVFANMGTAEKVYEKNTADAIQRGIVGAPGYVLNGEPFWGQDRLAMLENAIASGREPYLADSNGLPGR